MSLPVQQAIVFGTLVLALALFIWGRWRYDVVALIALLIVTVTGLVPGAEAFAGFGHAAVVTVAAVLVLSRGLQNAGVVDYIARWMGRVGERQTAQVAVLTTLVTVCSAFMNNVGALGLLMPVAIVLVGTMFLSDLVNNAAAALLMAPIAVSIAQGLGVSADALLMAVAIGASCAFLTPIGHQSNTLVMGPGGYHFGNYWCMGLPLEILITVVAMPLLLWFWPL